MMDASHNIKTMLDAALECATRDWHVFPVPPGSKQSYLGKDETGTRWGSSADPRILTERFAAFPAANLGIATQESGLVVLDLDRKAGKDGVAWLKGQITRNGDLPATIEAKTPSGGWHVYFKYPDGFDPKTCDSEIAPGVDVRGHGGFVVAPPSAKPGGGVYSWKNPPDFFEAAPLPNWLADLLPRRETVRIDTGALRVDIGDRKASADEVAEIISHIDPDAGGYKQWCDVLMGLHDHFGGSSEGLSIAETWSSCGPKFEPGEVAAKWKTFSPGHGVGFGTVAALARQSGADLSDIARRHRLGASKAQGHKAFEGPENATAQPCWPEPDARLMRPELPPAPPLDLDEVLKPRLARWIKDAAQSKGAPADYVLVSVLSVAGATIGNTRWTAIWPGWAEPPVIWAMCVGLPSAGKSPAIDAAVHPLRKAERPLREAAEAERAEWAERAELAKLAEATWKDAARAALKDGKTPPTRPEGCEAGPAPHIPRLVVNDGTIERLGAILARQPRGTLQMRDELAGWLEGMQRYSGGGSDRPFWLEAFGGRGFTVERMGREPLTIDRLTIGVLGGIQPDRLKSLLFKSDDDGLLARFLPIWPEPAPIYRPRLEADEGLFERALSRLLTLDLVTDDSGDLRPWFIPFTDEARDIMDEFRLAVREWEGDASGLLLSFIGKLPGLAARLALVLAFLDWTTEGGDAPQEINIEHFGRAAHLIETYLLPMARRAYADAAAPKPERAARQLVEIIRAHGWQRFTSREVLRLDRSNLGTASDLNPALAVLEEGDCIRAVEQSTTPKGGRPSREFLVNPAILGGAQ